MFYEFKKRKRKENEIGKFVLKITQSNIFVFLNLLYLLKSVRRKERNIAHYISLYKAVSRVI